jgi:hypothetical protein
MWGLRDCPLTPEQNSGFIFSYLVRRWINLPDGVIPGFLELQKCRGKREKEWEQCTLAVLTNYVPISFNNMFTWLGRASLPEQTDLHFSFS